MRRPLCPGSPGHGVAGHGTGGGSRPGKAGQRKRPEKGLGRGRKTLELNEEQRAELARLRALDAKQKARVLELLENTLSAADVHVFLTLDDNQETVTINYLESCKPNKVVRVGMDNPMAMLVDIFKSAGRDLLEEA